MSNKEQASRDRKSNQSTTNWPRCGVFVALAALIVAILGLVFGPGILAKILNNLSTFSYIVRVISQDFDKPLANITVELELKGEPPLHRLTDSSGIATFDLRNSVEGQTAKIVINTDGYHLYSQDVVIRKDSQTNTIQLVPETSPISPSPPQVTSTEQLPLLPSPTQTPENTSTQTPEPTHTWTPTITPTPTFTPAPTLALTLPFTDNFDQGLNSAWFQPISQVNWFVSNKRLTLSGLPGRQDLFIFVGDTTWTNYKIDLDFWFDRYTGTIGVIVRSDPPSQMSLRFVVGTYVVMWQKWQDGSWQTIDTNNRQNYAREGKISVEVRGNTLIGRVDGLTELRIDDYPDVPASGLIGLTSDCNNKSDCSEFDNFMVSEISP